MASQNRFVLWRRDPAELYDLDGEPAIASLESKITEAQEIISDGEYDTIIILEIKKVMRKRAPKVDIVISDYKGA